MKQNEYLNEKDVCVLLGVSRCTLYRLRKTEGLPFHKLGPKMIRYQVAALDGWLQERMLSGKCDAHDEKTNLHKEENHDQKQF